MTTKFLHTFSEPLRALIRQTEPQEALIFLKRQDVDSLVDESQSHTGFMRHFSEADLAAIIADTQVDWLRTFVRSSASDNHERLTLLGHLLNRMEMDQFVTWLPSVAKALNNRYTPLQQVGILKQCEALPGRGTGTVDGRHLLCGRIVPLILQDREHLDAWVREWMRGLKGRGELRTSLPVLHEDHEVTDLYDALDSQNTSLGKIPFLMAFAGALDSEAVMASVARFTSASLYEITNGQLSGHLNFLQGDIARRNLSYGMLLLRDAEALDLAKALCREVISNSHLELAAAILTRSITFPAGSLPVEELIELSNHHHALDALGTALKDHVFDDDDWFVTLGLHGAGSPLRGAVASASRFKDWCTQNTAIRSKSSVCLPGRDIPKLKAWVSLMTPSVRADCLAECIDEFTYHLGRKGAGQRALFYVSLIVAVFEERSVQQVKTNLNRLLNLAMRLENEDFIPTLIESGVVTLKEVAVNRVKNPAELELLTRDGRISRESALPHLRFDVQGHVFADEMGI